MSSFRMLFPMLFAFALSACPAPSDLQETVEVPTSGGPDDKKDDKPAVNPLLPGEVSGLQAELEGKTVHLSWSAAEKANRYAVYRAENAAAAAPFFSTRKKPFIRLASDEPIGGALIGVSPTPAFTDNTTTRGRSYRYQIVGVNDEGRGPVSQAIQVDIPAYEPYKGWARATAPYTEDDDLDDSEYEYSVTQVAPGGDAGLTTTTEFLEAQATYADCSTTGADVLVVRPAVGELLAEGLQTFSVELAGSSDSFSVVAAAVGTTEPVVSVFYQYDGALDTSCSVADLAFTVDTTQVRGDIFALIANIYHLGRPPSQHVYTYYRSAGAWARLASVSPSEGAMLTGQPLDLVVEYRNAVDLPLSVTLAREEYPGYNWWATHEVTTTTLNGSGQLDMSLSYEAICAAEPARARLDVRSGFDNSPSSATSYDLAFTTPVQPADFVPQLWTLPLSAGDVASGLHVRSCDGIQRDVTVTTSPGFLATSRKWRDGSWQTITGETIEATTGRHIGINTTEALGVGSYRHAVTVHTAFGVTDMHQHLHVFEAFAEQWLPAEPKAGRPYPVRITTVGVGPETLRFSYHDQSGLHQGKATLSAQGNAFIGNVVLPTCARFETSLAIPFPTWTSEFFPQTVTVTSSEYPILQVKPDTWYLSPQAPSTTLRLEDACGSAANWFVQGADDVLLFERLSGVTPDSIGVTFDPLPQKGVWADMRFGAEGTDATVTLDLLFESDYY